MKISRLNDKYPYFGNSEEASAASLLYTTPFADSKQLRKLTSALMVTMKIPSIQEEAAGLLPDISIRQRFPAAFSDGWRLAHHADDLWEAFLKIREEQGIPGDMEKPMQYFCMTVEYVLRYYGTLDEVTPPLSIEVWKEVIECSSYVDAERYALPP